MLIGTGRRGRTSVTVVGLIPARAGSKRLHNKNLAPLDGRPLIAYTCDAACASGVLAATYVNTDSPEIARIAGEHGVPCPALRPKQLAADDTPTLASNLYLLEVLAARGERHDAVMVLQPTSPLRQAEDIRAAWALFEDHAPCAVVSVSPLVPESWTGRIARDGRFERGSGDAPVYRLNGAIYIYQWDDYVADRTPRKTVAYVMPAARGIDIDTADDLEYARFLLRRMQPVPASGPGCGMLP